jgi:enoyl-CoA hydratase/carnithine racemase
MGDTVLSDLDGCIRHIRLNRPDRLNAVNEELLLDMRAALKEAEADDATRIIILSGAGRAFCSGDDLKDFDQQVVDEEAVRAYLELFQDVTREVLHGDTIVIGAIHGWAVGGALEWVINLDFTIFGESTRCFFPEVSLGLFVTGAVTTLLTKQIGPQRTKELIMFGEKFDARTAQELGIAWKVVPDALVMDAAMDLAKRIAALPEGSVRDLKRVVNRAYHLDADGAMALETDAAVRGFIDPESGKRAAEFGR